MKIQASFEIDVDIEAWAKVSNITVDEAKDDVLAFITSLDVVAGQTYATQVRSSAFER